MLAKDVMTSEVCTVGPDTGVGEIARLLLDRRISAVPVVDAAGKLNGIVSEGDLMRRTETGTERRRSWWLELLSENRDLAHEYVKSHGLTAKDVMTPTVVTVSEDTTLSDIASTLERNRIKRVPVLREGKLVGIVSRANLLQALAAAGTKKAKAPAGDRALREAVLQSFKSQTWTPDLTVNVTVKDGQVSLYGLVASEDERRALRVAAEQLAGVGKVNDQLSVSSVLRTMV
ncbi:MAG: CBS domain-containing protein [Alphaproteobacteria bacterium]|nr:CBS domain-containing protein [Alphaproteobacteria bacterium]